MGEHAFMVLALALIVDRYLGEPDWLWQRYPHPVVMFGNAISWMENLLYNPKKHDFGLKLRGTILIVVLVSVSVAIGWVAETFLSFFGPIGLLVEIGIVAILLAQKSLADHVLAVARALEKNGLTGGRKAIAMIVGRDPKTLDQNGICRAAIESLAENTSDGVVAPALFYAVFGLPGIFAYKMINTADSMIGHKSPRYLHFGWASARLDDVANFIPARLTGALACLALRWRDGGAVATKAWMIMRRDAGLHRSPNAGWPEAAFAGGLGIALGGPRIYQGDMVNEPFMHDEGLKRLSLAMIQKAVQLFWKLCTVFTALVGLLALLS